MHILSKAKQSEYYSEHFLCTFVPKHLNLKLAFEAQSSLMVRPSTSFLGQEWKIFSCIVPKFYIIVHEIT